MPEHKKPEILPVTKFQAVQFWKIFVNRLAYVQQSNIPGGKSGKHFYFKPEVKGTKERIPLKLSTVWMHLAGKVTIGVYAINPETQCCKWIAIDADYRNAEDDLKRLQEAFAADGIVSYPEQSRRGGHLWIFLEEPTPAAICRLYVLHKARALGVPVKKNGNDDGIEVFPKQDTVGEGEYGNAIRMPCGVHRGVMQRYWFEGAEPTVQAQLEFLLNVQRVPKAHLESLTTALKPLEAPKPAYKPNAAFNRNGNGKTVVVRLENARKEGRNYKAACPVCDRGRERHLSVKVDEPTVYRCWHNCPPEEIKRALGVDPRDRLEWAA